MYLTCLLFLKQINDENIISNWRYLNLHICQQLFIYQLMNIMKYSHEYVMVPANSYYVLSNFKLAVDFTFILNLMILIVDVMFG